MFAEELSKAQDQVRDLQKELGRLESDGARVHGLWRDEKRSRAAAEKARDGLAKKLEALQARFANATAQAGNSAQHVNALLLEQGEVEGLKEQVAQLKAELADVSAEAFGAKAEALAATRLGAAESAKVARLTLELDEAEAKLVRAEAAGRQAKDKLRESEAVQSELAQKVADQSRMIESFLALAGRS